jgi:extradiol dioxygenase family protein
MTWNKLVPELTVFDLERSRVFYTQLLGFQISFEREGFVYLELEGTQIMLEAHHESGWNTAPLEPPLGRGVNFQIELEDVAPVHTRLQAAGVALFREMRESWYQTGDVQSGQREFLVQDPDGYLLRFSQFLGENPVQP